MATVKFKSIDTDLRTATFDVDGEEITRKIPVKFEGTIDDYLTALARGLAVEAEANTPKSIDSTSFTADKILVGE